MEIQIFDVIKCYYNCNLDYIMFRSPLICNGIVENNFLKDNGNNDHSGYIKEKWNNIRNNNENDLKNDKFLNQRDIIKLVYDKPKLDKITKEYCIDYKFEFSKLDNAELYLCKQSSFTNNDKKINDYIEKIKKKSEEEFFDDLDFVKIGDMSETSHLIRFQTNKSGKPNIYQFIIVNKDNYEIHISNHFTLISFKQFLDRHNKSFLSKIIEEGELGCYYYCNGIFENDSDNFRSTFSFGLNFYYFEKCEKISNIFNNDIGIFANVYYTSEKESFPVGYIYTIDDRIFISNLSEPNNVGGFLNIMNDYLCTITINNNDEKIFFTKKFDYIYINTFNEDKEPKTIGMIDKDINNNINFHIYNLENPLIINLLLLEKEFQNIIQKVINNADIDCYFPTTYNSSFLCHIREHIITIYNELIFFINLYNISNNNNNNNL